MACPFARCRDVGFDDALGVGRCKSKSIAAVRLLLVFQAIEEDEEVAVPDISALGLRVTRKARCALDPTDSTEYFVEAAGISSSVQWLMAAPCGAVFLVTAKVKHRNGALSFHALSHMDTVSIGADTLNTHMNRALDLAAYREVVPLVSELSLIHI